MQIVIEISDKIYESVQDGTYCGTLYEALKNGTPLPKGHGRIMDADAVIKKMEEREARLKDDRSMWETASVETALDMFGETIIVADEEFEQSEETYESKNIPSR